MDHRGQARLSRWRDTVACALAVLAAVACDEGAAPRPRCDRAPAGVPASESAPHRRACERDLAGGVVCFAEPALASVVEVLPPERACRGRFSDLALDVPLRSTGTAPLRLRVQVEFLASPRAAYGERTTCQVLTLRPGEQRSLRFASARSSACAWVVRVWRAE